MVLQTGQGTVKWTKAEIKELLETGKVKGYIGHHINSVNGNNLELARNPNNIEFVKGMEAHLEKHGGSWRNPASGALLSRLSVGALAFITEYDRQMKQISRESPLVSDPDKLRSYINPFNYIVDMIGNVHGAVAAANAVEQEKKEEQQ